MLKTDDIQKIRENFPILSTKVHGKKLIYFDNAATTHKPLSVIEKISDYYTSANSNIHRGVHSLSMAATKQYEACRAKIANFINAANSEEIIFTRGTTEAINLVANSFGKRYVNEEDEVIISALEHHSNIIPWQILCEDKKAKLKVIPINDKGEIKIEELSNLITKKTKIIAVSHVSNALGTINNIKEIINIAHKYNIPVLIDGAQGTPFMPIDVIDLDCDFYCFSGHKIYAPMGIGVLYGKKKYLNEMPPYQGGGEMIQKVTFEYSTYNELPFKFEAGTPNVADTIALATAIEFIEEIGMQRVAEYEKMLTQYANDKLNKLAYVKIIGNADNKAGVISFVIDKLHPYDVGVILDKHGVAVRTGHHCAEPVMNFFEITGTIRASFAIYNTLEEIDAFINALEMTYQMLKI